MYLNYSTLGVPVNRQTSYIGVLFTYGQKNRTIAITPFKTRAYIVALFGAEERNQGLGVHLRDYPQECAKRRSDVTLAYCEYCGTKKHLGDGVRTYEVTTPISVWSVRLCWKCFEAQKAKERKHFHIMDKLHVV